MGVGPVSPTVTAAAGSPISWGAARIAQRHLPLDSCGLPQGLGRGIDVYVLDTGVFAAHPALAGRVAALAGRHSGDFVGDKWGNQHGSDDCHGHGTHLAGIVAGQDQGVASGATIRALRVARCDGTGEPNASLSALRWLETNVSAPAVVLVSLQYQNAPEINAAATRVAKKGFIVITAAGDSLLDACETMPSGAPGVLAVGGTNREDVALKHSNWGMCIVVWAPGHEIDSLSLSPETRVKKTGSSMAAAFVAGAAAVFLARSNTKSPADFRQALLNQATHGIVTVSRKRFAEATTRDLLFVPPAWYSDPGTIQLKAPSPPAR